MCWASVCINGRGTCSYRIWLGALGASALAWTVGLSSTDVGNVNYLYLRINNLDRFGTVQISW